MGISPGYQIERHKCKRDNRKRMRDNDKSADVSLQNANAANQMLYIDSHTQWEWMWRWGTPHRFNFVFEI